MKTHPSTIDAEALLALIEGRLDPERAEHVRRVLRQDARTRAEYDRLAALVEAFEPGARRRRMERRLFETLPETGRAESRGWFAMRRWKFRLQRPFGLALAGAGMAALVVGISARSITSSSGEFRARSAHADALDADHVLQVLRVRAGSDGALDVRPATTVRPGDYLRFAVFTRHPGERLSLVEQRGTRRRVLLEAVPLTEAGRTERLDLSLEIPPAWDGPVRYVAIFERGPHREIMKLDLRPRDEGPLSIRAAEVCGTEAGAR